MTSVDLSCQELVELITDYLEGALSERERTRFEEHLTQCPGCRIYLDQMQRTIAVVGRLSEDDLASPARDELLDIFRSWKRS